MRTNRGEIHHTWEGHDPIIHGVNDIATMQLEERSRLDTQATELEMGRTKRPSASHWFNGNIILKTVVIPSVLRMLQYPKGPGGYWSSPGYSRLLM